MSYQWLKKPKAFILAPMVALLALAAVACGAAATATPAPTAAPTAAPVAMAEPAAEPTAAPAPMEQPADSMMAKAEHAPAFADYWKPRTDYYGEPKYGGTIRINYEDPLEHANTWGASSGTATRLRGITHNNVINFSPYDPTYIIPDLAAGWTQKDDATGVTFHFHDNIVWHNGDAFSCEDVRFTLETWITGEGITASSLGANFGFLDMAKTACTDDLTLEAHFNGPSAIWQLAFAANVGFIFNKAWFQAGGEDAMFQDISVGTGPFTWNEGQSIGEAESQSFSKNNDYFRGNGALPYLDGLVIFGILDESAQQAAMLAHKTDWHWVRNWGQYDAYVNHEQIKTVIRATRGHHTLWMNNRNAPFDNVRVRQAIVMAMDRRAAIQVLQEGFGSEGFIMVPGSAWELDHDTGCAIVGWCTTDDMDARRAEAKQILEEEGFDFDKTYLFTVESDAQVEKRAIFMQEQLRLLGIQTDFDKVETVAYRQQTSSGTWGDLLPRNDTMRADDPFVGMGQYFSSQSLSNNHWCPCPQMDAVQTKADELLEKASITTDPAERKAISDELQILAMEQYWKFPVYWEQEAVAFWPEVKGYVHFPGPSGPHARYGQMWLDPDSAGDSGNAGQKTGVPGGI